MKPGATALTVMPRADAGRRPPTARRRARSPRPWRRRSWSGRGCRRCRRSRRPGRRGRRRGAPPSREQDLVHPQDGAEVDVEHRGPARLVHVGEQLVAGDAGVVHDDVETAVPRGRVVEDPLPGVGRRDVELEGGATDAVGGAGQRLPRRRDVDARPRWRRRARARRRSTAPMPRAAPVTTATLPGQRLRPVGGFRAASPRADPDHLPVDVCRAAGQQEPHRRVDVGLGPVVDEDEVGGGAGRAAPCRSSG